MTVPYWVQDAIFYQIFPDRFANGDPDNDPPNVVPWGSPPTLWNFMGGDLRGIIRKFDYLLDLGVTAIYLNPIFQATSNHRYNTLDYYKIDPKLGDLKDFHTLLEVAHRNSVRVILDGVFNHCGRGFFAFSDILENGKESPYIDWFHLNRIPVEAFSEGEAKDYLAWWGLKSLPKFNTKNPAVRSYLLDVARYWILQGADGWRLDVPNEIDDDSFWGEFREAVKSINRDAYLVGEIWTADARWVGKTHFDGLMNYPVRDCLLRILQGQGVTQERAECASKMEKLLRLYPRDNAYAMYMPLGSHDTDRIWTKLGGDIRKVKLAFLFLFAYPGAPAVYYGDEIGIAGGADPECRAAFPWQRSDWNHDLRGWVKSLISIRKRNPALRRGEYVHLLADSNRRCYAFGRVLGDHKIMMVINASAVRRQVRLPAQEIGWEDGRIVRNLMGREEYVVSGDRLSINLPAWGGVLLE